MSNMTTDLSRRENATMEEGTKTNETKNTFRELIESESDGSHVYSTTLGGIRRRLTGIQVAWIYLFWADELNAINRQTVKSNLPIILSNVIFDYVKSILFFVEQLIRVH